MTIEKNFFRQVMGHFATGVTIVTTNHKGAIGGLTVNAFCSVSLNPPLILVCVDLTSQTLPLIRDSKSFAVNMLGENQEELSRCFATHSPDRFDYFCHASYTRAATGAPIIDGALAFIDAEVVAEHPGGDHAIFIGQVKAMGAGGHTVFADDQSGEATLSGNGTNGNTPAHERSPLTYYKGEYRHLTPKYHHASLAATSADDAAK